MPRYRDRPHRQTSLFFHLPLELRQKIYTLALYHPHPINLCPNDSVRSPSQISDIALTSETYAPFLHPPLQHQLELRTRTLGDTCVFRLQPSLLHIRTHLATALLHTSRQIYIEAAPVFWTQNTWRFSHDERWEMLWRWLLTIGPAARARVQKLEVYAPFANDPMAGHGLFWGPVEFKNHPKMGFDKVIKYRDGEAGGDCRGKVFELLMRERVLERIRFVVPITYCVYSGDFEMPVGFSAKVTVVLEPGGWIEEVGVREFLDEGFDFVAAPDYFGHDLGFNDLRTVINPTDEWMTWRAAPDFLEGVSWLFEEEEVVETPANGGRACVLRKGKRLIRELKGFGPSV